MDDGDGRIIINSSLRTADSTVGVECIHCSCSAVGVSAAISVRVCFVVVVLVGKDRLVFILLS